MLAVSGTAQAPQAFKYQAVAHNTSGEILVSQAANFRMSILSGSASGDAVYTEILTGKPANTYGLVDLEIGKRSQTG